MQIDHIHGVRSDNRFSNLRHVTAKENQHNIRKARITNASGILGASPYKGKWKASIRIGGVATTIGVFDTPEEAGAAYQAQKAIHHKIYNHTSLCAQQEPTP